MLSQTVIRVSAAAILPAFVDADPIVAHVGKGHLVCMSRQRPYFGRDDVDRSAKGLVIDVGAKCLAGKWPRQGRLERRRQGRLQSVRVVVHAHDQWEVWRTRGACLTQAR